MNTKRLFVVLSFLAFALWSVPLFTTPTFDLDESLYRQSALEMKKSKNYLSVTWEGRPYYDKPPTFFWTMVAASKLIDPENEVSIAAAKLPSLLSTYLTALLGCLFWLKAFPLFVRRFREKGLPVVETELAHSPLLPALFLGWALLPTAGSSAAVLDPMLTLALAPVLIFLSYCYVKNAGEIQKIPFRYSLLMGLCMSFACIVKGPIGLIVPGFSLAVHEIFSAALQSEKNFFSLIFSRIVASFKVFSPMFLIGFLISFLFYGMMFVSGEKEFVSNFLFVQNLQRGLTPFEGHGGSLLYHWIVMFVGGFVLIPALLLFLKTCLKNKVSRQVYALWGYPLSWSVSIILFYSFVATKLPNYTWPMWIGFAIFMPIVVLLKSALVPENEEEKFPFYNYFLWVVPFLVAVITLSAGSVLIQLFPFLKIDFRAQAVIDVIVPLPWNVKAIFILCGVLVCLSAFFSIQFSQRKSFRDLKCVSLVAFLNSLFIFSICVGIFPFVKNVYWLPFVRQSEYVESQIQKDGGTFATIGLNSPTVTTSFHLFYVPQYPSEETSPFRSKTTYILLPSWLENRCQEYDYSVVKKDYYLTVCKFVK